MGRSGVRSAHENLERELVAERAAALGRIGERLERLLGELEVHRSAWASASGDERSAAAKAHRLVLRETRLYRWYLEVQREAIGLRGHDRLDESYPLPEALEG